MKIIKNTQSVFLLLLIMSFLTACSEEKDSVTPKTLLKIDKVTVSDGTFRNYSYDAQGRRSRIDYKDYYITYNYNGNTVIETFTYYDPTKTETVYTYTLNTQGLVSKRTNKVGTTTFTRDVEFDTNGRIIKVSDKSTTSAGVVSIVSEVIHKYDSDGDLVNSETRYLSSSSNNTITQYTIDKNHYNTTGTEFSGAEWIGKLSLHVYSKTEMTRSNGTKTTIDFPTTYDTKGYILSQIIGYTINSTTNVPTNIITANYTYK